MVWRGAACFGACPPVLKREESVEALTKKWPAAENWDSRKSRYWSSEGEDGAVHECLGNAAAAQSVIVF